MEEKLRNLIIALISVILLFVFVVPMLMNIYRGLRPRPTPAFPTPVSDPSFQVSF